MTVTIFTSTYNRADLLPRLYYSLCQQSCKDFDWIIVDDGSTDNTNELIEEFCKENKIIIHYYKKNNGGKHTAINYGVKLAKSELFFIVDSDDYLPHDSIYNVLNIWRTMPKDSACNWGGLCGLDASKNGCIIGSGLPAEILDTSVLEIRDKYGVVGDLKEIYLTSVLKEFPFPEIPGENFCPEILIWNRIAKQYKLRFFNKVIYIAEYQKKGISSKIVRARMLSPIATMMTYAEWFEYNISLKKKIRVAINYWRFAFCTSDRRVRIASWGKLLAPLGFLMHLKDKLVE